MLEKIKQTMRSLMAGRHGPDTLSNALLYASLGAYILEMILSTGILYLLGTAAMVYSFFRMISRREDLRAEENRRYVAWMGRIKQKARQAKARFDNRKQYKYFRCKTCRQWIRLPRGAGQVSVTCPHCRTSMDKEA